MVEIEKKFLLNYIPDLSQFKCSEIHQGYLSFTPEIRIRKKGERYFITKKGEGTQVREEIETEINSITYQILESLIKGRIIKKTRYNILLDSGLIAELDVYHDELDGLFTVETEFTSEEQARSFIVPDWFGEDITEDKRYKNKNLARIDDVSLLLPNNKVEKINFPKKLKRML